MKHFALKSLQILAVSLFATCAPANAPSSCLTRNLLPTVVAPGAVECGEFEVGEANGAWTLVGESSVQCANDALRRQTPFVLRHRGAIPALCMGDGMCRIVTGTIAAYVGGPLNGEFAVMHYSDGGTVAEGLHARKRLCVPAPNAQFTFNAGSSRTGVSLLCVASAVAPVAIDEVPFENACRQQ